MKKLKYLLTPFLILLSVSIYSQSEFIVAGTDLGILKTMDLDGNVNQVMDEDFIFSPQQIYFNENSDYLYWANGGSRSITRSDKNGENKIQLVKNINRVETVFADDVNNKLYYGTSSVASLYASDLDGQNGEIVWFDISGSSVTGIAIHHPTDQVFFSTAHSVYVKDFSFNNVATIWEGGEDIVSLRIDQVNEKLYWSDAGFGTTPSAIYSANFDGSGLETIIEEDWLEITSFDIDLENKIIYWADKENNKIKSKNLTTGNVSTLMNVDSESTFSKYSIDFSQKENAVYFTESSKYEVYKLDLANNQNDTIVQRDIDEPGKVQIVESKDLMYYIDNNYLYVRNMDGSGIIEITPGEDRIQSFHIHDESIYYQELGTSGIIYKSVIGSEESTIIIDDSRGVNDIITDVVNGHLYWLSYQESTLWKSELDGSNKTALVEDLELGPKYLMMDYINSRLYWTNASSFNGRNKISSIDLNTGTIIEHVGGDGTINFSQATLSKDGNTLYWAEGNDIEIHSLDLITNEEVILFELDHPVTGLVLVEEGVDVSTSELSLEGYTIAPNPAFDQIYINNDSGNSFIVQLFDLSSRAILKSTENLIDISTLNKGIYIIEVFEKESNRKVFKRIVKK